MLRILLGVIVVFGVCLLAGCPASQPRMSPVPVQIVPFSVRGTYVHEPSGFSFPQRVGQFQRTDLLRYDEAGDNISAGYMLAPAVKATVYVYPSPRHTYIGADPAVVRATQARYLEQHFQEVIDQIAATYPSAKLQDVERLVLETGGAPQQAMKATFISQVQTGNVSQAYLWTADQKWFVKWRITGWGMDQQELEQLVSPLLDALPSIDIAGDVLQAAAF